MAAEFVHLHLHSEMSLLDGMSRIAEIPGRIRELGMDACALTDHGVLYGLIDFDAACRAQGVRPILGVEAYMAPGSRLEQGGGAGERSSYHMLLLAMNDVGWHNLMRLMSIASLEGFYRRPRIDKEVLRQLHEGLIGSTGCLQGEVPSLLRLGRTEEARRAMAEYVEIFGRDRFVVEIWDHGMPEQKPVVRQLLALAKEFSLRVVATQDAHYLRREDAEAHDVLLAIQTGKTLDDPGRLRYPNDEFYVKSPREMAALFQELPEALSNTLWVRDACDVPLGDGRTLLPRYEVPGGEDPDQYLRRLCRERLPRRYPHASAEVEERLRYELDVIARMGYQSYFLIVADFVDFARGASIAVGPGRGSAAGSLVAYVLGITDVDPLRYHLLFERFLNPERVTMPDMDIDFDYRRRHEVIEYVQRRYGQDHVAQIITFGTMAARAAIRDVGRVLQWPYADVDRLAKLVPGEIGITLDRAIEGSELGGVYRSDERARGLLDFARRLEGLPRHASVHAAGVVIAPAPVSELVPLQRMPDGSVVTQFPMTTLEHLGLLKMDFLGLRTLTVVEEARRLAAGAGEAPPPLSELPDDDAATFRMLQAGDTWGVFQLESSGMQDMLRDLRPSHVEDIIAAVSLYRPGPMENIPLFVASKHGGKPTYLHPDLEPILRDTYGVIVYQEQVMQVAAVMAGYSLGEADLLRRAVGKKKRELLEAEQDRFVAGCLRQGYSRELGEQLFDLILRFANYGFNRAHGAAYGLLAYETAYLKAHHPVAYAAALLSSIADNTDKVAEYLDDVRRRGIAVLGPDVRTAEADFSVEGRSIRFGLSAIKGLGTATAEEIVQQRREGPFRDFFDFAGRLQGKLNRRTLEALVQAGACDGFFGSRAALFAAIDDVLRFERGGPKDQLDLFGAAEAPPPALPDLPDWPPAERLRRERESLGCYVTGHPLEQHRALAAARGAKELREALAWEGDVTVAAVVESIRVVTTRRGDRMGFARVMDGTGGCEAVVFPKLLPVVELAAENLEPLLLRGRIEADEAGARLVAQDAEPLRRPPALFLRIADEELWQRTRAELERHPGPCPVYRFAPGATRARPTGLSVASPEALRQELSFLGEGSLVVRPGD